MAFTQANRPIAVKTPLPDDVLLLRSMSGQEQLGRLFLFELDLLSEDFGIALEDVLGQGMTVKLNLPEGETRYFNGIVSRFCQTGRFGEFAVYQATLRPWFWFLTRTSDCRIFQNKTAPDIIKEVFRDNNFSDFEESLSGEYRKWEYCVQYRETDFNFISRLMEQEGIYYYFVHEEGKHTLKLSDSISAHEPIAVPDVPFFPPSENVERDVDYIHDWFISRDLQPGAYVHREFDFKNPKANLETMLSNPFGHDKADFEMYDYPGEYVTADEGNTYVRTRLEELHAKYERVRGDGNVRTLLTGGLFSLTGYPREDQNREYLVISAAYDLQSSDFESGSPGGQEDVYSCSFEAMSSKQPFRSARTTPKPVVQGPQTATVVGPSGDEIYTDEFGRVKVQFHWDRYGENNENSSCWIRVSQVHAGKGFGGIDTPRIGEEVIISFLEGDPDRPVVTGRVYNGDNKPPNKLPGAAMVSGLKSNSTPGGGGDNAMMLDDTKGNEKITVHGQYNMDTTVGNDQSNTIGNNRTTSVSVDDSESVGSNQTIDVGADQSTTVGSNQTITVGADQSVTIGANQTVNIGANQSVTVGSSSTETISVAKALSIGAAYQVSVGAVMNETVGGAKMEEIGGAKVVVVAAVSSENVGGSKSVNAASNISESAGGNFSAKAGGNFSGSAGGKMGLSSGGDFSASSKAKGSIEAASELVLKCGGASIVLKSGGEITIKGTDITIKGSGKIGAKAGGDIVLKGNTIKEN